MNALNSNTSKTVRNMQCITCNVELIIAEKIGAKMVSQYIYIKIALLKE